MSTVDPALDSSMTVPPAPGPTASPDRTEAVALPPQSVMNADDRFTIMPTSSSSSTSHIAPNHLPNSSASPPTSPSLAPSSASVTTSSTRHQQYNSSQTGTGHAPQLSPRTPMTATTAATSVTSHRQHHAAAAALLPPAVGAGGATTTTSMMVLHPNLPGGSGDGSNPEQTAQARAALVGTISNLLDVELQGRAGLLHSNARALEGQERDVVKATEALRKETDKLVKVVKEGSKKVLETGNVQNWAEVLERDFLVLEDTLRQVRRGSDAGGGCSDPDCSGCSCGSGSWSGSRTPSRRGSLDDGPGHGKGQNGFVPDEGKGKGKAVDEFAVTHGTTAAGAADGRMDIDDEGKNNNSFAQVNSAIAASISEAMASSIEDFFVAPPPAAWTEDVSPSQPIASSTTTTVDPETRDEPASLGDTRLEPSSQMDLDDGGAVGDTHVATIEVPASLDDREIAALEAVGLSPQVIHGNEEGKENQATSSTKTDDVTSDAQSLNATESHEITRNEDKMDVDIPDGGHT